MFITFLLQIPDRDTPDTENTLKDKLQKLNAEGWLALLPGVICLCLALQWGGFTLAVGLTEFGSPRLSRARD